MSFSFSSGYFFHFGDTKNPNSNYHAFTDFMQDKSVSLGPCDFVRVNSDTRVEGKISKTFITTFHFKLFDEYTTVNMKHDKHLYALYRTQLCVISTLSLNDKEIFHKDIVVDPRWFHSFTHENVSFTVKIEKDPKQSTSLVHLFISRIRLFPHRQLEAIRRLPQWGAGPRDQGEAQEGGKEQAQKEVQSSYAALWSVDA